MPLDAAIALDQRSINLEQAAWNIGIMPLPMAVLDNHKTAQLANHPGSFVGRHPEFMRGIGAISMIGCLVAVLRLAMVPHASMKFAIGELSVAVVAIGIFVLSALQFKAPAEWQSRFCDEVGNDVPASLRYMAQEITRHVPECQVEVGELVQNNVVLDPYLVIHHILSPDPIVIGIWDDDKIIASATRIRG